MSFQNLLDGFPGREFFENKLDGNSRTRDYGFSHHDSRIGFD
jgi:hypothetical protein